MVSISPARRANALEVVLGISFLVLFVLPGWAFFAARGGYLALSRVPSGQLSYLLFPLAGLYALFFVWTQIILGSNMYWLREKAPKSLIFHRFEGVLALLFAILHPALLLAGVGLINYLAFKFVAPRNIVFVLFGDLQLAIAIVTVTTALLRNVSWLQKYWYYIHYANYVLFFLVLVHSWYLGSDIQTTPLRYLWFFYAITAALSIAIRYLGPKKV